MIDFTTLPERKRLYLDVHKSKELVDEIERLALEHLGRYDPEEVSKPYGPHWTAFDSVRWLQGGTNDLIFDLDAAECHHRVENCEYSPNGDDGHLAMVAGNYKFSRLLDWTGEFYCIMSVLTDKGLVVWPEDHVIQIHSWW